MAQVSETESTGTSNQQGSHQFLSSSSALNFSIEHKGIHKVLEITKSMVDVCIERINANNEGVDDLTRAQWRQRLESVLDSFNSVERKEKVIDRAIQDTLHKYFDMDIESLVNVNEENIVDEINSNASIRIAELSTSDAVKGLFALLQPADSPSDNDLIIQDDVGINDTKTKCPFTGKLMVDPMKNENGRKSCIHHMSREGLQQCLARKSQAPCPIAGCPGVWSMANSSLDENFKAKIERYLRRKEKETQLMGGNT